MTRRRRFSFAMGILASSVGACLLAQGAGCSDNSPSTQDSGADVKPTKEASIIDAPVPIEAGPACDPNKPFGAPMAVTALNLAATQGGVRVRPATSASILVFSATYLYSASLSDDGGVGTPTLIHDSNDAAVRGNNPTIDGFTYFDVSDGGPSAIWGDKLTMQTFAPVPISALADPTGTSDPAMTGDTSKVYFVSSTTTNDAGVTLGGTDIYELDTAGGAITDGGPGWRHVEGVNTAANEAHPTPSFNAEVLYFARDASPDGGASTFVVYRASGQSYANVTTVDELNSAGYNTWPTWVSRDDCEIWLESDRDNEAGSGHRIFVARRPL